MERRRRPYTQQEIDEMRRRLYDRSAAVNQVERHQLQDTPVEVARDWQVPDAPAAKENKTDFRQGVRATQPSVAAATSTPRRRYRSVILLGSLLLFILIATVSSVYLYFGGNQISSANIGIQIDGPPTIGGGSVLPLQVAVTNQNSVPIESATLILHYPDGTRSIGDTPRDLFEERIPIETIAPGETRNVPVRVAIFGEEQAEKTIGATIEYRIDGSNGMFYKEATPYDFSITSSPLVLRVENLERVASGQRVGLTLTAVSNSPEPLYDILVTADFPTSFSYESSSPEPVFANNVWRIEELLPEETASIQLEGVVTGLTEEEFRINFAAGPASPDDRFAVGAVLAESAADFLIERPFIDVAVAINGDRTPPVVLPEGNPADVRIAIQNTLDASVYDMAVEVIPGGNILTEESIESSRGFYDSNSGTVRWEVSNNESFAVVDPNERRTLDFQVIPGPVRGTASFDLVVNVYARRVADANAQETLIGTDRIEAQYASRVEVGSQAGRNIGRFGDSGPIPPVVGELTTYTVTLVAAAGVNDIDDAVVSTGLPIYVEWLEQYEAPGEITYNPVAKDLTWSVGDIPAGERRELTFQVAIRPSLSQLGTTPQLIEAQQLRATDRFTGTTLQDTADPVTTELSTEYGFPPENGEVTRP